MPFDSVTTRAVAEDLRAQLLGGRVDKVVQSGDLEIALQFYAQGENSWLVIAAHAQRAHVRRTAQKQSGVTSEPSAFVMLLRKYLEGARLRAVEQQGVDRVLLLSFTHQEGETTLIAELMGKYSNLILIDRDRVVLGALKIVRAEENRVRVTIPRHPYLTPPRPMQPPPHADRAKLDPLHAIGGDLCVALSALDPALLLWKALLDLVDGLSPTLAREVTFLATGSVETAVGGHCDLGIATTLLGLVRERFGPQRGRPSAVYQGEKLVEWAAFPLRQYGVEPRLYGEIEALLEQIYVGGRVVDNLAGQRGPLVQAVEALRKNARRKVQSLRSSLTTREQLDALRTQGELLLAYQHEVEPEAREFRVPDSDLRISLDPSLTPVENAQRIFKRYGKARDAATIVPGLLEAAEQDLAYLDQLAAMAQVAPDPGSLAAVRAELRELNVDPAAQPRKKDKGGGKHAPHKGAKPGMSVAPLRVKAADGTEILVGRSARQNEAVTFNLSGPQDIWLHARQIPGAHVILRGSGRPPSRETLLQAAGLAAYYSQGRASTTVPVDYAPVRNVRRIKGGKPGLVHYSGETTINVRPAG